MALYHQIESGRAALAVDVAGDGDPVVFLHAAICDRRMWASQMAALGAGVQGVAYDRRGYGQTRCQAEEYSAVADLIAVMDAVTDGRPAILVGCSQGGRIALDAALQHPSRVRGLVLIAPTVPGAPDAVHPPAIQALMTQLNAAEASGDVDAVNAMKARLFLDGPLEPEGRVAGPARQLFLDMNGIALRSPPYGASRDANPTFQRLAQIFLPALVMWGNCDFPHIQARSRQVASLLPNGAAHELADTAHLPSLDRPDDVGAQLSGFYARCAAGTQAGR